MSFEEKKVNESRLFTSFKSIHDMTVQNHCITQFDIFHNSDNYLPAIRRGLIINQDIILSKRKFQKEKSYFFGISMNSLFREWQVYTTCKVTLTKVIVRNNSYVYISLKLEKNCNNDMK